MTMISRTRHADARNDGRRAIARGPVLAALLLLLGAGCRSDMYDQPKIKPGDGSTFFEDGQGMRQPVPGAVARGALVQTAYFARGIDSIDATGNVVEAADFPFAMTYQDLQRGQQRFNIYCAPCHNQNGNGRGMIVLRGFPPPPPLYGPIIRKAIDGGAVSIYNDLRDAPAGHFVRVMAEGHGTMYSYASRIGAEDRWRIAAYIRALQFSQQATPEQLKAIPDPTEQERALIESAARGEATGAAGTSLSLRENAR